MNRPEKIDFIMAGVGGQGTILASDILTEAGYRSGYDVKKSEVHGMSQRGGSVESQVRWGQKVYSPLVEKGRADYLVGFEMLEAARWPAYLAPGGVALVNRYRIFPPAVNTGKADYPGEEEITRLIAGRARLVWWIDATELAAGLGHPAVAGVILLGAMANFLPVEEEVWQSVVQELVPPRHVDLNRRAFAIGRALTCPVPDSIAR
ncbi:MAG TPA: indolepyruvate oxidoreductase subunit beta [Spirochaetia bacterium]|nr:indolepyruvate oxidoreductase subunit beta [Spirochaetia bacterium]